MTDRNDDVVPGRGRARLPAALTATGTPGRRVLAGTVQ